MKVIYLTDIHDALRELRVLLSTTEADLYLLSGDILYRAFYDEDKLYEFVCLQEDFWNLARRLKVKIAPFDLATDILRFPEKYGEDNKADSHLEQKATDYRRLFEKAAKNMKEKYETIEELIVKFSHAPALVLPGNYDIDLRYTSLRDRDLHQQRREIRGLVLAGYGGAPIATPGIPEKLAVVYHESQEEGRLYSEPQDFFEEIRPDILAIHNPAYGYFDRVPMFGHVGSLGIRNYLDQNAPALVVSGHVHEDYGVCLRNGSLLLNPSNFGGVDSPYGWQPGGVYAELQMDDRFVQNVGIMRLAEDRHFELLRVSRIEDRLQGTVCTENAEYCHLDLSGFVRDASGAAIQ
ncbi:MAG: metallophosphoesterase [Leptospirales bacterium]|nr:metallophosphoesterase [Leptospirales bacterium]